MPINKQHKEFYAVDMGGEWEVPEGYPEGIKQKILVGHLDEENKTGCRTRLLKFEPGVYTTAPFTHDYWEEVYQLKGDLIVGTLCIALVLLLCVAAYAGLARITWLDALRSFDRGEVVMGPVTVVIWPSRFILPISFALAGLVCLWHLARLAVSRDARAELIAPPSPDEGTV